MENRLNIKSCILLDSKNDWIKPYLSSSELNLDIIYDFEKTSNYDVCFLLGFTKILDYKTLYSNCFYLTIHESSLPEGKGFSPVQWQILDGKNSVDVCLIELDKEVDSGDILLRGRIRFDGTELYDEIRFLQAKASISLIKEFISIYPDYEREEQFGEETFFEYRSKGESELDIDKSLKDNFNLLRICNNEEWPAFFFHKENKYILKISKEEEKNE